MQLNEKNALAVVAAVLTTLLEVELEKREIGYEMHATTLYLCLNMNIEDYNTMAGMLKRTGFCAVTSQTIALTDLGRDAAQRLNASLARANNAAKL